MVETLLLVGPASAALSLQKPVPFASLAAERLVLPSPTHGLRSILDSCSLRAGIHLSAVVEADALTVLTDLVQHGFGLTVLPLAPIHRHIRDGTLTAAPLVDPAPTRTVVLADASDRPPSAGTWYVARSFVDITADLVSRRVWIGEMLR